MRLCLLAFFAFAFSHRVTDDQPLRQHLQNLPHLFQPAEVVGVVDDAPTAQPPGWRFPLKVEQFHGEESAGKLLVQLPGSSAPQYGTRVRLRGIVRWPGAARNPADFDFAEYLRRQGISGEMDVRFSGDCTPLARDQGGTIMAAALQSRDWIARTVTEDLEDDPDIAAVVRAMVLGTRETTPQDIEDAFVTSGTMHVFAVSGLHVALFAWVLWQVLRVFGLRRGWVLCAVLPCMFFYVFITGLRPSAWRAAIMATVFLCAPLCNRRGDIFNNLGAAALVLLAVDSQQLFQPGFQLSFGVLFVLALLTETLMKPMAPLYTADPYLPKSLLTSWQRRKLWFKKKICESLAVSTASTVGSAPLMLAHFKLLSPIGILANLFLVFLSITILCTACLSLLCAALSLTWLTPFANNANFAFASLSIWLAKFFASVPGGHIRLSPERWFDGAASRLTILDLRMGAGMAHLDADGHHWLFDCGGHRTFMRFQRPHLLRYPATQLDGIILTHQDADHISAAGEVMQAAEVNQVLAPPDLRLATTSRQPRMITQGQAIQINETTSLEILYPPAGTKWPLADDRCLIFRLQCEGWRILFLNDAGFLAEKFLLESGTNIQADVVVKGRHSSDFSGLGEFLAASQAKAILFSNDHFPATESVAPAWIHRLANTGVILFDQAATGAVELEVSPAQLELRGFANGQSLQLQR